MEKCFKKRAGVLLLGQAMLIYCWLTVLSPLAQTDTYYSVYVLCAVLGLLCLYDNHRTGGYVDGKQSVVLALFAGMFSVAVVLANYALFEPLTVLQNLFDAACVLVGGAVVGYQILLCMYRHLPIAADVEARLHPGRVFWLVFGSIAVIDLGYLFSSIYPGILTTDSFTTIAQLTGVEPYNNTMPFWHTMLVKAFVDIGLRRFGDMNAAVAFFHVFQILFMAACFAHTLVTLYQAGVPKAAMAAVYALYAFMPYNMVYSVTLWKDIPFAGAALLLVTALYRLLRSVGKEKGNLFVLILGAVGFSLLRTNGWYAFLVTALVMFFLLRKQHKKLLLIMAVVLLVCWVLINPLLSVIGVESTNLVEAFAVPFQQMARVVATGQELTQEQTELLSQLFWMDKVGVAYDPNTVDPVKFDSFRYENVDYITENLGDFVRLYLELGLKYPIEYGKAWIEETKGYWNAGYKFWTYTLKLGENPFGIVHTGGDNLLARLYAAAFRYIEKPAVLQFVTSIGLYAWTLIGCFVVNILRKRQEALLCIPILVLLVGLWLGSPVFAEFRYAYPMILTVPLILCVSIYRGKQETE